MVRNQVNKWDAPLIGTQIIKRIHGKLQFVCKYSWKTKTPLETLPHLYFTTLLKTLKFSNKWSEHFSSRFFWAKFLLLDPECFHCLVAVWSVSYKYNQFSSIVTTWFKKFRSISNWTQIECDVFIGAPFKFWLWHL